MVPLYFGCQRRAVACRLLRAQCGMEAHLNHTLPAKPKMLNPSASYSCVLMTPGALQNLSPLLVSRARNLRWADGPDEASGTCSFVEQISVI